MLSHDFADRTLPPTERHRSAAKSRGEVPRSAGLTTSVTLLVASCLLWSFAPLVANTAATMTRTALMAQPPVTLNVASAGEMAQSSIQMASTIAWPVVLVLFISGVVANVAQTGWLWVPAALSPQIRLTPMLSWGHLAESMGRLIRFAVLALVAWRFLIAHLWKIHSIAMHEPLAMLSQPLQTVGELCIQLSACLVVFSLCDYGIRFWKHEQNLKMTVEERRAEQRDDGTDPRIKQSRKAMINQQSASRSVADIEHITRTMG